VWALIRAAREFAPPGFAAWLQVAAYTGMRGGELDAVRWDCINFDQAEIHVAEQFSSVSRTFTLPKNGKKRYASLPAQAREALEGLARESEFCFVNTQRRHWTSSSRDYYWSHIKKRVGYEGSVYLATRHFAASQMVNVLGFSAEEVAIALGHEDGGALVARLYGHRDKRQTLARVVEAYDRRSNVVPLLRIAEGT
jgi:integrase